MQAQLEKRLAKAPPGRLAVNRKRRTASIGFYQEIEKKRRIYLRHDQLQTIRALAQKEYDRKALRLVRDELRMLRQFSVYCESPKLEDALEQVGPEKRAYIAPVSPSDEEYRRTWLSQQYFKKLPLENDHPFPTEKGDLVCSKTEVMLANYMFHHGYDYLYEKRLELLDEGRPTWRYPDFTILDPVTREEVIFEHFGMVDDENYLHSMFQKIRLYEENGYIIGKNFLFTFETAEHPFTMDQFIRILEARFPKES